MAEILFGLAKVPNDPSISFVFSSSRVAELLDTSLALLHKEMATVHSRDDDLSDVFVSRHAEVVWQHIMHKNKQLGKEIKHGQVSRVFSISSVTIILVIIFYPLHFNHERGL